MQLTSCFIGKACPQVYPEGNQSNNNQFFAKKDGKISAIDGLKAGSASWGTVMLSPRIFFLFTQFCWYLCLVNVVCSCVVGIINVLS